MPFSSVIFWCQPCLFISGGENVFVKSKICKKVTLKIIFFFFLTFWHSYSVRTPNLGASVVLRKLWSAQSHIKNLKRRCLVQVLALSHLNRTFLLNHRSFEEVGRGRFGWSFKEAVERFKWITWCFMAHLCWQRCWQDKGVPAKG